jgi:hypothetical protein
MRPDTRPLANSVVSLAAALILSGCVAEPEFSKQADYTPETLAQELAFRFRALSPSSRNAVKNRTAARKPTMESIDEKSQAKAQSKEATKKAPASNVDGVLDDIGSKAATIRGIPRGEVFQRAADAISKDTSLEEPDRRMLAEKLKEMGKA